MRIAVKALNDVLDEGLPLHPLEEQRESVRNWRQIGLGIFGLADMLVKMEIPYGSKESIEICDEIGYLMIVCALTQSCILAKKDGSFPLYDNSVFRTMYFCENEPSEPSTVILDQIKEYGLRNSQLLTIAPTGSISTMLGVSGGIEPIFANSYQRTTKSLHGHDETYTVYTPIVKKYMEKYHLKDESELPKWFVTAQDIDYHQRIDMQAVWQKHIDASISSTINVPHNFTVKQVEDLYMYAWERHLKGVTIFREGSGREGILTTSKGRENKAFEIDKTRILLEDLPRGVIIKADDDCVGKKRTLHTGCGTLHCEAFFHPDTGDLLETYLSKGSQGGCNNFMVGLSRMISLAARGGIDIYSIVDQLKSSGTCPSYAVRTATKKDTSKGSSCPVAIGNALLDMYKEFQDEITDESDEEEAVSEKINSEEYNCPSTSSPVVEIVTIPKCPECGGNLVFEGGCNTCKDCGWSKCD